MASQIFAWYLVNIKHILTVMEGKALTEEFSLLGATTVQKLKEAESSNKWQVKDVVKGDKPYTVYKMEIDNRISTKGVATKVEGTVQELAEMLKSLLFAYKLDPQMTEFTKIKNISDDLTIVYMKYKGVGPVSDREFVVLEKTGFENDGNTYIHAISSCPSYPHPENKDIIRGEVILGGYLAEKVDEKTFKLTYVSDVDIKGSIPDFVKKILSGGQDDIVSKIDGFLKEYRNLKKK